MLSKSFVAIAMLSFIFATTAFGQKEIVVWSKAKGAKNGTRKANIKSPRDVSTGQVLDDGGAILGDDVQKKPQSNASQRTVRKPKAGNLIDTSTGEVVWADEAKVKNPNSPNQRVAARRRAKTSSIYSSNPGQGLLGKQKQRNR